jgi:hypothetical protein
VGGLISVIICIIAAAVLYGTGHRVLLSLSIAAGIIALWSWGAMHNFATESAARRRGLILENMRREGRSDEDIVRFDSRLVSADTFDVNAVPNWIAAINMLSTIAGLILLIWGAFMRLL